MPGLSDNYKVLRIYVRLIDLKIKFLTAVFLAQLKVPEPEIFELMFYTIKAYPIHRDRKKYFI